MKIFLTRGFSRWKWFPGIYRDRPTWGNLEFYKTQMEIPIFILISSRRKLIIHGIFFFFFKLQTLWRKLHPEESFHISTKPRLEIGNYHWNRRENKNLKIKRTYRYRKLKFLPEKIKEMSDKVGPSLTSRWRAELEDISLLEGREFAAMELVAWSCIAWLQQKPQQFSLWVLDLAREKERDINVTASK